jgi:hypothetical protein
MLSLLLSVDSLVLGASAGPLLPPGMILPFAAIFGVWGLLVVHSGLFGWSTVGTDRTGSHSVSDDGPSASTALDASSAASVLYR